ncbi:WAS/WASL-interacting protein family member 1 isoform X3 [Phlebotomus papatasi]|uniref:WAS/WASL-interacting protein family member 1 isoform X3 n=1 Tax=Phlebotomus papatasi TaxID=29031 RepID=UPI0024843ECF|nr:WAS/WASL-interacting protein family member 1 isoform X3 [Phlebotomus papatasi]
MAVPPPPAPPAPPPQPVAKIGGGSSGGGDARSALLQSIQKGTKLKKTVTVDKSGPALAGRVTDGGTPTRSQGRRPDGVDGTSRGGEAPKLAGIFEGLSSMPKLKPVGQRGGTQVSPVSPARDVVDADASRNDRKQQQQQQKSVTEANLKINRGPPPNPPMKTSTITPPDSDSTRGASSHSPESKRFQNVSSNSSGSSAESSAGLPGSVVANKSSLFNTMANQPMQIHKPNHGKPNLAPKPPGAPPGSAQNSGKTSVARHHSMKSPRLLRLNRDGTYYFFECTRDTSPPVTPSNLGGPVFPTGSHFGTLRGTQNLFQSQESIHVNGRPSGRPTVAPPPRPPASRPPPPPIRSVSNTNLSNLPPNSLSTPISDPQANSSSLNNVSALKEQLKNQIPTQSGTVTTRPSETKVVCAVNGNVAPPLPPHRTCPAPPPPVTRQVNNASNVPPVPPQRHSSIRNSAGTTSMSGNYQGESVVQESIGNGRLVIDLEARFAMRFHNVTEFPKPPPFVNSPKMYASSHSNRTSNVGESRKQRAPKPPNQQQCSPKLNEYNYFSQEISNC